MKKMLLVGILAISIIACNEEANLLKKMEQSYRKHLEDMAFKNNGSVEIMELKALKYDKVDEKHLDTLRSYRNMMQIDKFKKVRANYMELAEIHKERSEIIESIDSKIKERENKKSIEYLNKALQITDSVKFYLRKDSALWGKSKTRDLTKKYYKTKMFIKATLKDGEQSDNLLDTVYIYFDNELKTIF